MSHLSQADLDTLELTACTAAAYLDACDAGATQVRLDPTYYQACGRVLTSIFTVADAYQAFPELIGQSPSAREVAEAIEIGEQLKNSRLGRYWRLATLSKGNSA